MRTTTATTATTAHRGRALPLAVLAVLAALCWADHAKAEPCGDEFTCKNKECTAYYNVCNGDRHCSDGSDEDPTTCAKLKTHKLRPGQKKGVRVQYRADHGDIWFLLCDSSSCSRLSLSRRNAADGALRWHRYAQCNNWAEHCQQDLGWHGSASTPFPDGANEFVVERRAGELAVWVRGHPEHVASVPVREGSDRLRVKGWRWVRHMQVDYTDHTDDPPPKECDEFRCANNNECTAYYNVCNGDRHCADGSDEDPTICSQFRTQRLGAGESVGVRVQYRADHGDIWFLLCDSSSCSRLSLSRRNAADGALRWHRYAQCNNWAEHCQQDLGWHGSASTPFPDGANEFVAERRAGELAVWVRGHPEHVASVPVREGSDRLRVKGWRWVRHMQVDYHSTTAAADGGPSSSSSSGSCGRAVGGVTALTLNGKRADPGAFPWHAGVYYKKTPSAPTLSLVCGGSLVSARHVVSAAHCFFMDNELQAKTRFAIGLGKVFSDWDHDEPGDVHKTTVADIVPNPLFRGIRRTYADDVAVVQLERPVKLGGTTIVPICLDRGIDLKPEEPIQVVGWGNGDTVLSELQWVALKFLPVLRCLTELSSRPLDVSFVTYDKFCSWRDTKLERPPGLAQGDSGGGAVYKRGDAWFLVGIVSVAIDGGKMFGFTSVKPHLDWIAGTANLTQ